MTVVEQIIEYYNQGYSLNMIEERMGLSSEAARQILIKANVPRRHYTTQSRPGFQMPDKFAHVISGIYVIQGEITRRVKIGSSDCIPQRIYAMQSASPDRFLLVYVLEGQTYREERELHARFAQYRLHGEWFSEEVLEHIAALSAEQVEKTALA